MASHAPADKETFLTGLPRPFAAAAALVTDQGGRVLLLKSYRAWMQPPGGVIEADESPDLCARRELAEETGLNLPAGELLAVCWVTATAHSITDMPAVHFYFDMGSIDADTSLTLQDDEIDFAEWVPLEQLADRMGRHRAARFHAALAARRDGRTRLVTAARAELAL